jgi:ATP-dependent RNA helicase DeaD
MTSFNELGLSEEMLAVLEEMHFKEPTDIQAKTIPLVLEGRDVIAESATGSGKTLAFGAGMIEKLEAGNGVQGLVMAPTRELAEQVGRALIKFSKHTKLNIAIVYGGVSIGPQVHDIEEADIVVGTPGRLLDHIERRTLNLDNLKVLVLDEADRMLDMGFIEDVVRIIEVCPQERQSLLFSATMSGDIAHLAKRYMNNPAEVTAVAYVDPSKLEQIYYDTPKNMKLSLLVHLLKGEHPGLVMVFCNTRHAVDFVERQLLQSGIDATAIHGGLTQARRNAIIQKFHSKNVYVLVCTDVAARGLDITGVSHVYNFDLPANHKEYIHRVGRTARAGKEGKAINIVAERDYDNFRRVMMDPSLVIKQVPLPDIALLTLPPSEGRFGRREGGGRFGSRDRGSRGDDRGRSGGRGRFGGGRGDRGRDRDSRGSREGRFGGSRKRF